jgi:hypothetical protein
MEGATESEPSRREIRTHILFEVATEVANRGEIPPAVFTSARSQEYHSSQACRMAMRTTKADTSIAISGWYLLGSEVQSSRHDSRVWRAIYIDWAAQSSLGTRFFLLSFRFYLGCQWSMEARLTRSPSYIGCGRGRDLDPHQPSPGGDHRDHE